MRFILAIAAVAALVAAGLVAPAPARAAAPCVATTIAKTTFYFPGQAGSGYVVIFASNLGVASFKGQTATIVDRYSAAGSPIARARTRDKIKLCLTQTPRAGNGCNPAKDYRGRIYSAYDQRLRLSFSGANADHTCGGA
jgi:hypothetical protein